MTDDDFKNKITFPQNPEKIRTVQTELKNGTLKNTFYPFFNGIFLELNDVNTPEIPTSAFNMEGHKMFLINYCINGRCEFRVNDRVFKYIRDNQTCLGTLTIKDAFYYPTSSYLGFELVICPDLFNQKTLDVLKDFNIDINHLMKKFENEFHLYITETPAIIKRILFELYNTKNPDAGMIKLNVLKILHEFCYSDFPEVTSTPLLSKTQADMARTLQQKITEDLSVHIPVKKIAQELSVSESGLKNYFFTMYGQHVFEYLRSLRLKKAARLLSKTKESVADIAAVCGFTNQGRFAKIFCEYYGVLPLEYRRISFERSYESRADSDESDF